MFDRITVDLAALVDAWKGLTARADQIDAEVTDLRAAHDRLEASTVGAASAAALADIRARIAEVQERGDTLRARGELIRTIADIYDTCDLAGARAFGT